MVNNIDTVWSLDSKTLDDTFEYFISSKYPTFIFKYNWDKYPYITDYIKRLMISSYIKSNDIHKKLPTHIHDVEDFFACGINSKLFNKKNIGYILKDLRDRNTGFNYLTYLPKQRSGFYGYSVRDRIEISSNYETHPCSPNLTSDDLRKLYLFHEMGHKIINILKDYKTIYNYQNTMESYLNVHGLHNYNLNQLAQVENGFFMIEECLVQEMAEYFVYKISNKERPKIQARNDVGCVVYSNYDYYCAFQLPTMQLGRTLRGCATNNVDEILINMVRKALNNNFCLDLVSEYASKGINAYYDLFIILKNMGFIKQNKYSSFGMGQPINVSIPSGFNTIKDLTSKYVDYRNSCCINHIDFSNYYGYIDYDNRNKQYC